MARHRYILYRRRRSQVRRFVYYGSALVIIVVLIFLVRPRTKDDNTRQYPSQDTTKTETESTVSEPVRSFEPPTEIEPGAAQAISQISAESNKEAVGLIAEAQRDIAANKIIAARDKLNEALRMLLSDDQRAIIKRQLSALADKWLFSRNVIESDNLCGTYTVKTGDMLANIAKAHRVSFEILQHINNIRRPEALQAGETIKVIYGPCHAIVRRSSFTMDLYLQNTFVRSFPAGLGKQDRETPTGLWRVKRGGKLIKPTWTDPDTGRRYEGYDPDYPLGSRWIGLEGVEGAAKGRIGFAIHGTKKPDEIGKNSSRGCIRLHNGDAILVYNLMVPVFSEVRVAD